MSDDDLRPQAREIVDIARSARTPSAVDKDRVYQTLMAGLAGGAAASVSGTATAAAKVAGKSSLFWVKGALSVVLVSAAAVGTYVYRSSHRPAIAVVAPTASISPEPTPAIVPTEPVDPTAAVPRDETGERTAKAPAPSKSSDDFGREAALLHDALSELKAGRASHALELAREHARRFPTSQLRSERSALQVRALCALGQQREARRIAEQLRSQAPNSPVSAALGDTCANN